MTRSARSKFINSLARRWRACAGFVVGALALAHAPDISSAAELVAPPPAAPPSFFELPSWLQLPPPAFDWNGVYIGVNVGGGFDHFAFPFVIATPDGGFTKSTGGISAGGPVGGVQAGFNYALPFFHLVAGLEFDFGGTGIRGDTGFDGVLNNGVPVNAVFGTKYNDFATGRLRLGYAFGRFLPYLAGGFTWGNVETFYSLTTPTLFASGAITESRSGVIPHVATIGGGIEYGIAPNITAKVEYLYDFLNARPVTFVPYPGTLITFNTRTAYHIARVGLNYKFDWFSPPAPIVAKY